MVDGVCCIDDGIENMQRAVLLFDIITDTAGPLGDCVHKEFTQGHRGKQSIKTPQRGRAFTPCVFKLSILGRLCRYYSAAGD